MYKTALAMVILSALTACTGGHSMVGKNPGTSRSVNSTTDAAGTVTTQTTTTEMTVDEDGQRRETVTSTTSTDPKGWMNKTTSGETSQTTIR